MSNHILIALKQRIADIRAGGFSNAEMLRNVAKEELQFYVLNYVYHHPVYSQWIMYGGSALRICHGLNRMSVDLDFEIDQPCDEVFLDTLTEEIATHFSRQYAFGSDLLTIKRNHGRGLKLVFTISDEIGIEHASKQIHVKIDLNHFVAPKTVTERIPISRAQLAFTIKTYNMSSLMASKIAAVMLRGTRLVGKAVYEEKGRDMYDLLWYMEKKIVPDLDYLIAKKIDVTDLRALFDRLTLQMNKVSDKNLLDDLSPLFESPTYIRHWLAQWRETYLRLLKAYDIRTITALNDIHIHQNVSSDNYGFTYVYNTEEGSPVRIVYTTSDYWFYYDDGNIPTDIDSALVAKIHSEGVQPVNDRMKQYVTLFHQKNVVYLKKTNNVVLGNSIHTKILRLTADTLNRKEEIVLTRSALLSCELEDLLK